MTPHRSFAATLAVCSLMAAPAVATAQDGLKAAVRAEAQAAADAKRAGELARSNAKAAEKALVRARAAMRRAHRMTARMQADGEERANEAVAAFRSSADLTRKRVALVAKRADGRLRRQAVRLNRELLRLRDGMSAEASPPAESAEPSNGGPSGPGLSVAARADVSLQR